MKPLPDRFELRHREHEIVGETFTLDHVPAVHGLEELCFPAPWSEGLLRQEAESRQHAWNMVVHVDGRLKAFFFNWIVLDEMHLLNIAVSPELQGKGLGGRLLDWLLEEAAEAGFHSVSLEVRESNRQALALYESRGFDRLFLRRNYYSDNGEDAIIMLRKLRPDSLPTDEESDALSNP